MISPLLTNKPTVKSQRFITTVEHPCVNNGKEVLGMVEVATPSNGFISVLYCINDSIIFVF